MFICLGANLGGQAASRDIPLAILRPEVLDWPCRTTKSPFGPTNRHQGRSQHSSQGGVARESGGLEDMTRRSRFSLQGAHEFRSSPHLSGEGC